MTSISHALIAASIAAKIPDPFLASTIAIITHFFADAIPHWDLGTNWRLRPKVITGLMAIAETLVAFFGTILIFSRFVPRTDTLIAAIFFSLLPDWLEAPYYMFLPSSPRILYYPYKIQSIIHRRAQLPEGVINQFVVVGLFLIVGFLL